MPCGAPVRGCKVPVRAVAILADMSSKPAVIEPPSDVRGPRPAVRASGHPQGMPPQVRVRRAVTLLVMALLVPGLAQWVAGSRRVGRIALRALAGVIGFAALIGLVFALNRGFGLAVLTSPVMLILAALGCYLAAVGWSALIVDAWRLGRPGLLPGRARIAVTAFAVVAVVLVAGTTVGLGRRMWAGADAISGVFGSGRQSDASAGRFNVLLLGGDAGPDRIGTRPDSMTLASVDADTGRTVLFSLPRNLEDAPFAPGSAANRAMPQGWSCGDNCLLNGIYTWGTEHKDLFPQDADPGAAAMKQAVEGITGLRVNYYVLIDLRGFSSLIDAMGGIDLTVNQVVPIGGGTSRVSGYIQPGTQHLDGYRALWFARSRHGANDYERMARQRCVMDAMLRQLDPATVLTKFQGIAAASKQVVSTDLPAGELATFLDLAVKAKSQKISSVQFVPPLIDPAHPDFGLIRSKVSAAIDASEHAPQAVATSARASGPSPVAGATVSAPSAGSPGSSPGPSAGHRSTTPSARTATSPAPSPVAEASDVSAVCAPA
jgi:LCP family protein required for cell wall assembly